ncbi:MAG: hypothetical protein OXQ29_26625, partial [Rhodospirillaceae bacterium]|nr:hypothetical protein [Rhodospirillaceae bacterium]
MATDNMIGQIRPLIGGAETDRCHRYGFQVVENTNHDASSAEIQRPFNVTTFSCQSGIPNTTDESRRPACAICNVFRYNGPSARASYNGYYPS